MCGSRSDQHMAARQGAFFKMPCHGLQNLRDFRHAAKTKFSAGHFALIWTNHVHTISLQCRQITLCRGMIPHTDIH